MNLVVSEGGVDNDRLIFEKILNIDEQYFLRTVNLPEESSCRTVDLLKIAEEIMPELRE